MAQPYSTTAQAVNRVLTTLAAQAGWSVTEGTGDVALRIAEGDRAIDSRLAGLEIALPFSTNPPMLLDLSVLYARYACFRDLYSAGQPEGKNVRAAEYLDLFEKKWGELKDGWARLLASDGTQIASTKFATLTVGYPCPDKNVDAYPNYPSGPYPDPPGIGG